jgi:uncharacterized protein YrrD
MRASTPSAAPATRTARQLMGMPVITLSGGRRIGVVHDVFYTPLEGALAGFTVRQPGGFLGQGRLFLLRDEDVHSIGDHAVTVVGEDALTAATRRVKTIGGQSGQSVLGKRLLTESGTYLGHVYDVAIDRASRKVVAYVVSRGRANDLMKGRSQVPVPHVVSVGADVVVVPDFVAADLEASIGGLTATAGAATDRVTSAATVARERIAEAVDTASEKVETLRTHAATAIEQREMDFSRGRVAGRTVTDDENNVIVTEGESITQEHLDRALAAGKVHALALSAGYQVAAETTERVNERADAAAAVVREQTATVVETARERASGFAQASRDVATEIARASRERQSELLVGKTTGRPVLNAAGDILIPEGKELTGQDVDLARAAGKIAALVAAVGEATLEAARDRATDAYATVRERVEASLNARGEMATVAPVAEPTVAASGTPTAGATTAVPFHAPDPASPVTAATDEGGTSPVAAIGANGEDAGVARAGNADAGEDLHLLTPTTETAASSVLDETADRT